MIKYFTDLHLKGVDSIDRAVMESIKSQVSPKDVIVFGGDVFDSFKIGLSHSIFYDYIKELSKVAKAIYILTGNHDEQQGVCSFRLFDYSGDNIFIIEDYFKTVIDGVNYHFLNHFRYNFTKKVVLGDGVNVLFSHAEVNSITDIPKAFKGFDFVYNGHIHEHQSIGDKFLNVGAYRKTRLGESDKRCYLTLEGAEYTKHDFITPVAVKSVEYTEGLSIKDVPSIITVVTHNKEEKVAAEELRSKLKNVVMNIENFNNLDVVIKNSKKEIKSGLDVVNIFKDFMKEYELKYKPDFTDGDRNEIVSVFNKFATVIEDNKMYDIKFKEVYCENFKLFKELGTTFLGKKGVILVKGINNDEMTPSGVSSNESGKTVIRQSIEYALTGTESKITPLRDGEKKGEVNLDFSVNGDDIVFKRTFTAKTNDLSIVINGTKFCKDMTTTDRTKSFFEKYPIKNLLDFILLYDSEWVSAFFNPKSNQKAKILADMFPKMLAIPGNVAGNLSVKTKELNNVIEALRIKRDNLKTWRKATAKGHWDNYFTVRDELSNAMSAMKDAELQEAILKEVKKPKYTREFLNKISNFRVKEAPIHGTELFLVDGLFDMDAANEAMTGFRLAEFMTNMAATLKDVPSYVVQSYLMRTLVKDTKSIEREISGNTGTLDTLKEGYLKYKRGLEDLVASKKEMKCHECGQQLLETASVDANIAETTRVLSDIETKGKLLGVEIGRLNEELSSIIAKNEEVAAYLAVLDGISNSQLMTYVENVNYKPVVIDVDNLKYVIENGHSFNTNVLEYREYREAVTEDIDIAEEYAAIEAYNVYLGLKTSLETIVSRNKESVEYLSAKLGKMVAAISEDNKKSRSELKGLRAGTVEEEYRIHGILFTMLTSKTTFTFENYYASIFLNKIQAVMSTFLGTLFTRPVEVEVKDADFVFTDNGITRMYGDFSKGATTKVDIALVLTLSLIQMEYGLSTNFMYIDEFLDKGVDEINIKRVIDLLRNTFGDIDNLYVVSHKNIDDIVDNIIYVVREGGKSTIKK